MKNSQKGFIVPLLIIIIAVLVIGGVVYFYHKTVQESQNTTVTPTPTASSTTDKNIFVGEWDGAIGSAINSKYYFNADGTVTYLDPVEKSYTLTGTWQVKTNLNNELSILHQTISGAVVLDKALIQSLGNSYIEIQLANAVNDYGFVFSNDNNMLELDNLLSGNVMYYSRATPNVTTSHTKDKSDIHISITKPYKNAILENGQNVAHSIISWNAFNLGNSLINIDLIDGDGIIYPIARHLQNQVQYSWSIPQTISDGDYKIMISTAGENPNVQSITSSYFKIVSVPSHTNPTISVLWPMGGENLKFGQSYNIKWKAENMELENIVVSLRTPDGTTCNLGLVPASEGNLTVILSKDYQCPGNNWQMEPDRQYQVYLFDPAATVYTPIGKSSYFKISE